MNWRLYISGVRGSYPMSSQNYEKYGGHTSCAYLDCGEQIIFDAGTGIQELKEIDIHRPVHILLSHMHLDHIQGLPCFPLLHEKDAEIHIYSEIRENVSTEGQLSRIFSPPYWPLKLEEYPATVVYHDIEVDRPYEIGGCHIQPIRLNHPDQCTGYIIEGDGKKFAYLLDCDYKKMLSRTEAKHQDLFQTEFPKYDAALMDAFFPPENIIPDWGHSSWKECVNLAAQLKIKKAIVTHYSEHMDDIIIEEQEKFAAGQCVFAREGMWLEL